MRHAESQAVRSRLVAGVATAGLTLLLVGCTSSSKPYPLDRALDKMPTVAANSKAVDLLPSGNHGHVVTAIRTTDGKWVGAIALFDGQCFVSVAGPEGNAMGFATRAPRSTAEAAGGGNWTGERATIGPAESAEATQAGGLYKLDCGTRGAWVDLPFAKSTVVISGAGHLSEAVPAGKSTGILITSDGS